MKIMDIARRFNVKIIEMLNDVASAAPTAELKAGVERIISRIKLAKSTGGDDYPIKMSSEFFIKYAKPLIAHDVGFFHSLDPRAELEKSGRKADSTDEFMLDMVRSIRCQILNSNEDDRKEIFDGCVELLELCSKFGLSQMKK